MSPVVGSETSGSSASSVGLPEPIPYELRIGVTGHRALGDEAGVRLAVDALLDHVQRVLESAGSNPLGPHTNQQTIKRRADRALVAALKWIWPAVPVTPAVVDPSMTTPLRWRVVSALAQGADIIVAEAVLARKDSQLQVVLPFDAEEYEHDFDAPSLEAFRKLLALDASPGIAGMLDAHGSNRDCLYREAGELVVHQCDILIAVWDGKPAKGWGGTGDIVKHALLHGRTILWINADNPRTPAKLVVPESSDSEETPVKLKTCELPQTAKEFSPSYHALAAYNRDTAVSAESIARKFREHQDSMLDTAQKTHPPEWVLNDKTWQTLAHYARSDVLSLHYQNLHFRSARGLFTLAASGVTVSVMQMLFAPSWYAAAFLEVLAMVAILALLRISRKERWHEKWLHDRHFAERLRAKLYTDLLGEMTASGQRRDVSHLPFYRRPADWVDVAIMRASGPALHPADEKAGWLALRDFIEQDWITPQAQWHMDNVERKLKLPKTLHRVGLVLFSLTLVAAFFHAIGIGHGEPGKHGMGTVTAVLFGITVLLPLWGATFQAINTLLDGERISSRSANMARLLNDVAEDLRKAETPDEIRAHVRTASDIMASENYEWAASLAFHGPHLPA
ncbi:MAG: hypothetical protein AMXMBFR84_35240 [Candidatus Hydrogenedentota bacterium]